MLGKRLATNIFLPLIKLFLLLLSVSCITSLGSLVFLRDNKNFAIGFGFYPMNYFTVVLNTFTHLFTIWDTTFFYYTKEYDVFPYILEKYFYTMSILFFALIITIFVSFFFSYLYLFFSKNFKRLFLALLVVLDSIPDIIIILASQLFIISLYQKTGIKLLQLYGIGDNVYLLPIICLSFVPIVMVTKIMIKIFEEETEQQYVEFAIAKGLSRSTVFIKHVVPNVLKSLYSHIGLIYWSMLSSLFVIEYLFQMQGFTPLLYRVYDSSLNAVVIIMILIPFGLLKLTSFRILKGEYRNV